MREKQMERGRKGGREGEMEDKEGERTMIQFHNLSKDDLKNQDNYLTRKPKS